MGGGKQWGAAADSFVCAGAACCVQAYGVAVGGSYAYVVGANSDFLAIVDVSNKAAPTLIGSLIDSTIMKVALRYFGKKDKVEEPELQSLKARRLDLLEERMNMRHQSIDSRSDEYAALSWIRG